MKIAEKISSLLTEIPKNVCLVAVSKTKPLDDIQAAYRAGQRVFGENKIQEMTHKWEQLPKDIEWHMIGHVQSNKVKYMAPYVSLIHGVDRAKLLKEIDKQAAKNNRSIDCLLQIHIAEEETKFGLNEAELFSIVEQQQQQPFAHLRIVGLMGMATFTTNTIQIRKEFNTLKKLYERANAMGSGMHILSMGMSGDYPIAIEEGSTMIRVGSKLFGERNS